PSQSLKEEITKFGYIDKRQVEVVPICIPDNTRQSKDEARQSLIDKYDLPTDVIISITSGRLVEQKGHEFLIEAAVEVVSKYPQIRFLLLGDGHLEEFLKQKIKQYKLEPNFIFAGMQDNIDLELNGADIMIHPSRKEPFGIAVLESMRSGLPIVASKVGGIPEVVSEGECAFLTEVGDYKILAHKIIELLDNPDKMTSMGLKGRERYERVFKLDNMIDQLEKIYNEVVNPVKLH
ncbi:glycosyltransferase family 4 protein, partial [Candidatus Zixiibacteriota bacterium]